MLDFVLSSVAGCLSGFWCVKAEHNVRASDSFAADPRLSLSQKQGSDNGLKLNNRLILEMTALGFMMLASNITGFGGASFTPSVAPEVIEVKNPSPIENKKISVERRMTVEEYVRNYFSDIPVLVEIAKCESRFRQHDINGNVLRGEENSLDRGVMQINQYYHDEESDKLGYDILTLEGNTAYARALFEKYGVQPWVSSSKCWGKTTAYAEYKDLAVK